MTGVSRFQEEGPDKPIWRTELLGLMLAVAKGEDWRDGLEWEWDKMRMAGKGWSEGSEWRYDKTEDEAVLRELRFWDGFDYALMEDPKKVVGEWRVIETVWGFAGGVEVLRPGEGMMDASDEEVWRVIDFTWGFELEFSAAERYGMVMEALLHHGLLKEAIRRFVTRGWWIGPRMEEKIHIMERIIPVELNKIAAN
ncbi:hypothetical protein V495_07967 [Pseudogymnoascus sp. VKM F-4514 (FW-929)]|nr:hypothetical protein V495_07967 [Pseudogymnoascus sp. VKM F-4514 (FW-929)]